MKIRVNEIWAFIPGYEGLYQASSMGRIKSCEKEWYNKDGKRNGKKTAHIMKGGIVNGYHSVVLFKDGIGTTHRAHRVIANIFIDNPEDKPCVNHINGIKTDNRVENLEWCTVQENTQHAYDNELIVAMKRGNHSQAKRIKCTTLDIEFNCINDAADILGVYKTSIGKICNGVQRQTNGLVFKFI